jgi:hypothetical protein
MNGPASAHARRGYLVIPARVESGLWDAFNRWYGDVHLPDASKRLNATKAFRLRRLDEGYVHVAVYELEDVSCIESEDFQNQLQGLVAEFNAAWPTGVERERMFFEVCD